MVPDLLRLETSWWLQKKQEYDHHELQCQEYRDHEKFSFPCFMVKYFHCGISPERAEERPHKKGILRSPPLFVSGLSLIVCK